MTSGGSWRLIDVQVALDDWTRNESPHPALRRIVIEWLLTRQDDPYLDVRREPAFDNLWFGAVPRSEHGEHSVVVVSYWISERDHAVRCDQIASLTLPV